MRFLAIALLAAACGGPVQTDDAEVGDLMSGPTTLAAWNPFSSYTAARKAAAALVGWTPHSIQLYGARTPGPDNMHTQPQPKKAPLYQWNWTFRGPNGVASVAVARGAKPVATKLDADPAPGLPPIDYSTITVHAKDVYNALVAAFPNETHHAFDELVLAGPQSGYPQGWQIDVYQQGDDDTLYLVDSATGAAQSVPLD